jgi:hypothetical protein
MRFAVDITRNPDGHYEGALAWGARDEPFEFSGLLELLSVIERELSVEANQVSPDAQASQGAQPTLPASGTPRPGSPTTGGSHPGADDPPGLAAQI